MSNGNYDNYGGITDSLLSAEANKDPKESSNASAAGHRAQGSGGPLLDFKSAFSDLDSKPSDLRYTACNFQFFDLSKLCILSKASYKTPLNSITMN